MTRFDRFYSWLCKTQIRIIVAEDYITLSGAKMYTDKMQSTLEGKALLRDKRIITYLGNVIVALILLFAILINYQIIDTFELRKTYHKFRLRNIE
ncbi:hypothetical protein Amet_2083 [Alkaliphilus metalliredigens QYMF]|uniref:Uncharacterized protein n=1 Tax=Alkaliphilus metalliredigens (strain QYMF) TaxID=293826 RepID=A6TPX5_ALKMQ|nr:hypothetical protein [Alkaliphilus metalliredigens]ABR48243.1 hypothetical protein Amet_2083 [Alkaliphilus metalliredigens QYMF]